MFHGAAVLESLGHASEDDVFAVQVWRVAVGHEKLRAVGVRTGWVGWVRV